MCRASVVACLLVVAAAAAVAARAAAQDRPAPSASSDVDARRARAWVAWRRAAWRLRRDEWTRAQTELEAVRKADADAGRADFTTLWMLGTTYLRLAPMGASAQLDSADIALSEAHKLMPDSPRLAFADALRETVLPEGESEQVKARVESTIGKFGDFFRAFAHPGDDLFGEDILFLAHFYRGRAQARLPEALDGAVKDLNAAIDAAERNKRNPPVEVVSLLAQVYMKLDQVEDAKRVVRDALARDPTEASNYYNLGQTLLGAQDPAGAKPWFEAALLRQPDFPEAQLALAQIARKSNDPSAMRRHLEAAAALQEMHARAGSPVTARVQSDLQCGFGICWKMIGDLRADAGDDAGMRAAFETATARLLEALSKESNCFNALLFLLQIKTRVGAPQSEIDDLKQKIEKLQHPRENAVDPFRSTFC